MDLAANDAVSAPRRQSVSGIREQNEIPEQDHAEHMLMRSQLADAEDEQHLIRGYD